MLPLPLKDPAHERKLTAKLRRRQRILGKMAEVKVKKETNLSEPADIENRWAKSTEPPLDSGSKGLSHGDSVVPVIG